MSYATEVLADSPSAWFRLGETSGTAAVDQIGGASGTYVGGFTLNQPSLLPTETDPSVLFTSASRGYVRAADRTAFDRGDTLTVEAWVYMLTLAAQVIADKGANAYIVRVGADGTIDWRRNNVGNICQSRIRLAARTLYHVVCTKRGNAEQKIYINGVDQTGTVTNQTLTDTATELNIGAADAGTNGWFNGSIDEFAIYPTALSAARVLSHYTAGTTTAIAPGGARAGGNAIAVRVALPSSGAAAGGTAVGAAVPLTRGPAAAGGSAVTLPGDSLTMTRGGATARGTAVGAAAGLARGPAAARGIAVTSTAHLNAGGATAGGVAPTIAAPEPEPDLSWAAVADPVRPTWDEMLAGSHPVVVQATLLASPARSALDLPVVDGTVTLDATAATRGRLDMTVSGVMPDGVTSLVPTDPTSLLAPYGGEIQVSRGIRYPDGGVELVPLGVFGIYESGVDDTSGSVEVQIAGMDRSQRIIEARFEEPYQIAQGTNVATAILTTIRAAYPDVVYDFASTALTTLQLIAEEEGDRWAFCQSMATAIGMELFFDGAGVLILRQVVQSGGGTPDAYLVEGEGGVLVSAASTWTREGAYNKVIATGESTSEDTAPARGVATDTNPLSPTYYYGRFGRKPFFYVSPMITTDQQAADAAAAMLGRQLGTTRQVSFGSAVDPKRRPGDVVQITRQRTGIDELHVVDQVTIPLAASGTLSGSTRAVQVGG